MPKGQALLVPLTAAIFAAEIVATFALSLSRTFAKNKPQNIADLDVQAQNPYNADFRRTGLAIIAKVCEELKKR